MTALIPAKFKDRPEDFFVAEILGFSPADSGEHRWLFIEKTGMNTAFVKRKLADITGLAQKDISHSGLKDRHAVARQWLCLPAKGSENLPEVVEIKGESFKILENRLHNKKLRIGTHKQNSFVITLRGIAADNAELDAKLEHIRQHGFANGFGPQRFGQKNLQEAQGYAAQQRLPKKPDIRSRVLSTLRSEAFNRQLAVRIEAGNQALPAVGDVFMLAGTHSHFQEDAVTDELITRCQEGGISPAGWLPGKGSRPQGEAGEYLAQALQGFEAETEFLLAHCTADYRPFTVLPEAMDWTHEADTLTVRFVLPAGSYATALLGSIFALEEHDHHSGARD